MPHYRGENFYQKAILKKTTVLSSCVFHVPQLKQHSADCCILKDIVCCLTGEELASWSNECSVVGTEYFTNLNRCSLNDTLKRSLSLSQYEEEKTCEIIPSSVPDIDEDCSFNLDLSFEKEFDRIDENISDCILPFTLCTKLDPLDVPIFPNELLSTFDRLQNILRLIKKMKSLELKDPFVKSNGSYWKEEDIFQNDLHFESIDPEALNDPRCVAVESFDLFVYSAVNDFETVLFPASFKDEFQPECLNLTAFEIADEFYAQNEDKLRNLLKGETASSYFVTCLDDEDYCLDVDNSSMPLLESHIEGKGSECLTQPIFSCSLLDKQHAMETDITEELLNELSILEEDLSLLPLSILNSRQFMNLERKVWYKEKHYDEMQIPVPLLPCVIYPDFFDEATELLGISEIDLSSLDEHLTWNISCPRVSSPTSSVSGLHNDAESCFKLASPEEFERIPFFDLESQWECATKDNIGRDNEQTLSVQQIIHDDTDAKLHDPVDAFLQVRARQKSKETPDTSLGETSQTKLTTPVIQSVITPMVPTGVEKSFSKTIEVNITESFKEVLEYIQDYAKPYMTSLKMLSILSSNVTFMDISVDKTQFLLKEYLKQNSSTSKNISSSQKSTDFSMLISLYIVHTLRSAADLLLHCGLETCISWVTSQIEGCPSNSDKSLNELCKQLRLYQCTFHQENILHPKLSTLCHEIETFLAHYASSKVLIIVQRGFSKLLSVIQHVLSKTLKLTPFVGSDLRTLHVQESPDRVFIVPYIECQIQHVSSFSLVVVFDERMGTFFRNLCRDHDIAYFDLKTQYTPSVGVAKTNEACKELTSPISMICSTCLTQYRQLVYLLEARYNILVIERDYRTLSCGKQIYFADLIVGISDCIVLLPLQDVNKHIDLEVTATRLVTLGLQFSNCFIILHGLSACSSYLLDKETLGMIFNLQASLLNLCATLDNQEVQYKILYCLNEEDVAKTIQSIAQVYMSTSQEQDLARSWLSSDISQSEEFLLQFSCLSSFSAQLLLKSLTLEEILNKSEDDIKEIPEIPKKVLMYLSQSLTEWKSLNPQTPIETQVRSLSNSGRSSVSADSYNSLTYSPLVQDQEVSPLNALPSPDLVKDDVLKPSTSYVSCYPQHQQLVRSYQQNEQSGSLMPDKQLLMNAESNKPLALSQPHFINCEEFDSQESCENSFGILSDEFFPDEAGILKFNSQAQKYCEQMPEVRNTSMFQATRNDSSKFHQIHQTIHNANKNKNVSKSADEVRPMSYNLNINSCNIPDLQALKRSVYNNCGRVHSLNKVKHVGVSVPHSCHCSNVRSNFSDEMDFLKKDCSSLFSFQESLNNPRPRACSKVCNEDLDSLHHRDIVDNPHTVAQPVPDPDSNILNLLKGSKDDENLSQIPSYLYSDHAFSKKTSSHHSDNPFDLCDISNHPWIKGFSQKATNTTNYHMSNCKALGIVEPSSGSKFSLRANNVPYFDRFSQTHKCMPVQPVLPSLKEDLKSRNTITNTRSSSSLHLASNLPNSNFKRKPGQKGNEGKTTFPNIPRQKISIGLATPLRKQIDVVNAVENIRPPQLNTVIARQGSESPPLDLTEELHSVQQSQQNSHCSKLKQWNTRLMTLYEDPPKTRTDFKENTPDKSEPLLKRRKLQAVKKAGNKGQTVLVFK
uniref:Protein shortage in chiasmata 1 ortholog n=1 Tax=Biomphalaria glabrata TaxID=6526 RepID=A0A2C9KYL8_BIOGL